MKLQFGSSGIRGEYPEGVNPPVAVELVKRVLAGLGRELAIGHDSRFSNHALKAILSSTAIELGAHLKDYRFLPTPALSYETHHRDFDCGIMITASHNPPEYNGFKVFNSRGEAIDEESPIASDRAERLTGKIAVLGTTEVCTCGLYEEALSRIKFKKNWRVVLDPGNGATSEVAPRVYANALTSVTAINCIAEPNFSGRGPEPTISSMRTLSSAITGIRADAGVAFDGDGDRMYLVDEKGVCHLQDRVLAAYISHLSSQSRGPFLVPLDVSMCVDEVANKRNARLVRGPVGDAKLLREMKSVNGTFAGEPSGAWIHPQFNPCPDGILSGLLFLQAVESQRQSISQLISGIPEYHMIRESMPIAGADTNRISGSLAMELEKIVGQNAATTTRFGLRVSTDNSWILVRQSGTEPLLRITVESKIRKEASRILRETLHIIRRTITKRA